MQDGEKGSREWKLYNNIISVLQRHNGETRENEGAIDVVERLSKFWNLHHPKGN